MSGLTAIRVLSLRKKLLFFSSRHFFRHSRVLVFGIIEGLADHYTKKSEMYSMGVIFDGIGFQLLEFPTTNVIVSAHTFEQHQ